MGELIGYARVSSRGQNIEPQIAKLKKSGVKADHLYQDTATGTKRTGRPSLTAALDFLREGDTLVCTRLDRLARSTRDLHNIAHILENKGVQLWIIEQEIDTSTAAGRLFFTMLSAISAFETEVRADRQREGIAAALAKGDDSPFKGRPATIDAAAIKEAHDAGETPTAIAKRLGIARSSVYRYLSEEA